MSCWGWNYYGQVMPLEMLFDGAAVCCGGEIYFMADLLFFLQLGDGSTTNQLTPVAVSGLSSSIANIALGGVRLFVTAVQMLIVLELTRQIFFWRCFFFFFFEVEMCDVVFAVAFLCALEQWHGVMLGIQ